MYDPAMPDIRPVTDAFATAPQLVPADMREAAALGYRTVINNRPDHESDDQPTSAEMRTAAEAAGLRYVEVPFAGAPAPAHVEAVRRAVAEAEEPVLAFCRSGTRSITAWALAQAADGRDRVELLRLAHGAGYDLTAALSGGAR